MLRLIFTYLLISFLSLGAIAQNSFEGIIIMTQETATGLEYTLKWFIKKDKIAYEITSKSSRSGTTQLRFVPKPDQNTMLMVTYTKDGEEKAEIAASDIESPNEFQFDDITVEEGKESSSKDFEVVQELVVENDKFHTVVEITPNIDIDFNRYAAYFKADYGIFALIKSGKKGFPLNSVTKDASGKVLSRTKLQSVQRTNLSDDYFQ